MAQLVMSQQPWRNLWRRWLGLPVLRVIAIGFVLLWSFPGWQGTVPRHPFSFLCCTTCTWLAMISFLGIIRNMHKYAFGKWRRFTRKSQRDFWKNRVRFGKSQRDFVAFNGCHAFAAASVYLCSSAVINTLSWKREKPLRCNQNEQWCNQNEQWCNQNEQWCNQNEQWCDFWCKITSW